MGVKGAHPLGSLPLWGSEGVTLAIFEDVLESGSLNWKNSFLFYPTTRIIITYNEQSTLNSLEYEG